VKRNEDAKATSGFLDRSRPHRTEYTGQTSGVTITRTYLRHTLLIEETLSPRLRVASASTIGLP
jgi:hypothetical protein